MRGAQGSVWTCADSVSSLYVYVLLGGEGDVYVLLGFMYSCLVRFELVLLQDREPRGLCTLDMYVYERTDPQTGYKGS